MTTGSFMTDTHRITTTHDEREQLSAKSAITVAGVAGALAVGPFVLLLLLAQAINPNAATASDDLVPVNMVPVAKFELVPAPKGAQSGQQIFESLCTSCHTAGTNGAPKIGTSDWAPRIAQGFDVLYTHAWNGFNQMPAKGGGADLSEVDVKKAIVYMANKSGGSFPEPVDPNAKDGAAVAMPAAK
jgi:cytochrome c5